MALLTLRRNSVVRTDEIIDELWGEDPPKSAMTTLQTYIYKLRGTLAECDAADVLRTTHGGYMLVVPDDAVDLHAFEQAVQEGRAMLADGNLAPATDVLASALAMWDGQALVDVQTGDLLSAYVTRMEEIRFRALELCVDTDLRLGRHMELLSELKALVAIHPLHERFHAALMVALQHAGRRYEALEVYRILRANLIAELGIEPSPEVQQIHQELLSADPPARTTAVRSQIPVPRMSGQDDREPVLPAQLPPAVADLTGRARATADILAQFDDSGPDQDRSVVVITGMPGVGKTALAVHVAHQLRGRFPDGQLFAELPGHGGSGDVEGVIGGLLRALGAHESHIPGGVEERGKLFRSMTYGRRMLIVLDGATSAAAVRPLLPGDLGHAVIVTSRQGLHGLDSVRTIHLGVLTADDSLRLLGSIIGHDRVRAELPAARRLVELAGRLPLAVRCLGGRLAVLPDFPLDEMAQQLSRSPDRLSELRFGDEDLRARYDSSYERLGRREQAVFRLLSMLPMTEFDVETAAEMLGCDSPTMEAALERILGNHLLELVQRDNEEVRYVFPELTRLYASEQLAHTLEKNGGEETLVR